MKRFFKRTAKILGISILFVVFSAFIWANWEAPGPGMRAPVVDFLQYDISNLSKAKREPLLHTLRKTSGVNGVTFNPDSKILVVSYFVSETSRSTIESIAAKQYSYSFREKIFIQSGPRCPVDVAWISRVKKTLCFRD